MAKSALDAAKGIRREHKANVIRHLGLLERVLAEEDTAAVQVSLETVKSAFHEFELAHDVYSNLLIEQSQRDSALRTFRSVELEYISGVRDARAWLKTTQDADISRSSVDIAQPGSVMSYTDMVSLMNIPKVEIDAYDGDPMKYLTFVTIFDETIDSKLTDSRIKLTGLLQYTTGAAMAAISNCALIGGDAGYTQARAILKDRFGNSHLISQRIISSLKDGKSVNKANDVQQLADELAMACTALKQLDAYGELNSQ